MDYITTLITKAKEARNGDWSRAQVFRYFATTDGVYSPVKIINGRLTADKSGLTGNALDCFPC